MSATGLEVFVNNLTSDVTSTTLWNEITKAAPFIAAMLIVAVGYYVLRKVIKKASKLKAGI